MSADAPLPKTLHPAWAALDRRLDPRSAAPLALGLSGGSDSLALLLLASRWAGECGRPVLALTVDHRLHPDSAAWTATAGQTARRLGAGWRALTWTGAKPAAGLPAAARDARHALMAGAARKAGAAVLLIGHTADDVAESELIRLETPAHGRLAEWAPSPAWPEGRGVFLLRPLLDARRTALRTWLETEGLNWLDDPANADGRYARTRARNALGSSPSPLAGEGGAREAGPRGRVRGRTAAEAANDAAAACRAPPHSSYALAWAASLSRKGRGSSAAGLVTLSRPALLAAPSSADLLGKALLCAGGGRRPAGGVAVERLLARLHSREVFTATLGGARLKAGEDVLVLSCEPSRSPPASSPLTPGAPSVFDGRFELVAAEPGWRVARLAGHAAGLPRRERDALFALPAEARPTLPVLLDPEGRPRLPAPFGEGPAVVRSLVGARLQAALGVFHDERALHMPADDVQNHGGGRALILS